MDTHRIGTFNRTTGQFSPLLDLNDGENVNYVRGSFKVTPYQKNGLYTQSTRRYGGSRQIGETHGNGSLTGQWLIQDGTGDAALARLSALLQMHESARGDLFYEWKPEPATSATYYELRGGLQWDSLYEAVPFNGSLCTQVSGGWQIAPLALGPPMDIIDDFAADTIASGEWDQTSGVATITGGKLGWASASGAKMLRHVGRGYTPADLNQTIKITTGASVSGLQVGLFARQQTGTEWMHAQLEASRLAIYRRSGGVDTLVDQAATSPNPATDYWLRLRLEGDLVWAELFIAEPSPLATPTAVVGTAGLTGTGFGEGRGGPFGIYAPNIAHVDLEIDDFDARPYSYVREGSQTVAAHRFDLPEIPGNAPAKVDVHTTTPAGIAANSALIGWASTPEPDTGTAAAPFGLVEGTGTSDGDCSGGSYADGDAMFTINPSLVAGDDFSDSVSLEVWAILVGNVGTPDGSQVRVTLSAFSPSFAVSGLLVLSPEYGPNGHLVNMDNQRVFTRAGTLTLPNENVDWQLQVSPIPGFGVDCLIIVPARQRACTSTGHDGAEKWIYSSPASETTKVIRHDLTGGVMAVGDAAYAPTSGLSGQLLEFPPGDVSVLQKLGARPVDDPDDASFDTLAYSEMAVHYAVTPRYHLVRSDG